jgi:hypothetical protein
MKGWIMSKEYRYCALVPRLTFLITVFALVLVTVAAYAAEAPYEVAWVRQIGTPSWDYSYSVAVDASGNAYISGYTYGSLGGPNAGSVDAFLAKYDASGSLLWTRQMGTTSEDYSHSVAVDGLGNAYISGYTGGSLGGPGAGNGDAFLVKYDSSGSLLWTRQIGTFSTDYSRCVAVDGLGNAYISGYTWGSLGGPNASGGDAFLAKYDSSGSLLWTRQMGTADYDDYSYSVAVDGLGNAYISGYTGGSLGGPNAGGSDAFLAKYDSSGSLLWTRQIGTTAYDPCESVAVDGLGNAYISGYTLGSLGGPNAGGADAFLAKYDSSGSLLWARQIGTPEYDYSYSVAVDASGNAYISGYTHGSLGGPNPDPPWKDAFLVKYDSSGSLLWTRQIGTPADDMSYSVAVDGLGNAYISGYTLSSIASTPSAGGADAFLAKFSAPTSVVPEPGTIFMVVTALAGMAAARLRRMKDKG